MGHVQHRSGVSGVVQLLRLQGADDFTDAELAFVDDIASILAEGLRSSLTGAPPLDEDPAMTPDVIQLDQSGVVTSMTDRAADLVGDHGYLSVSTAR